LIFALTNSKYYVDGVVIEININFLVACHLVIRLANHVNQISSLLTSPAQQQQQQVTANSQLEINQVLMCAFSLLFNTLNN
jgi:hypothetical protein